MSTEYVIRCDDCDQVIDSNELSEDLCRKTINNGGYGYCSPLGNADYCFDYQPVLNIRGVDDE